ncbi:MAG: GYD domain-containing protein [Gaiellales bacterium]
MARYLLKVSYTAEGARGLLKEGGTKRKTYVSNLARKAGAKIVTFDFAFGSDDVYLICEAPGHAEMTALSLSVAGSGAASIETVVLISPAEVDAATKKAIAYRPPGA